MKFLVLLAVVAGVVWWMWGRRPGPRSGTPPPVTPTPAPDHREAAPRLQPMLACVHCGLHLPRNEAVFSPAGEPFCSDAHRLAGPRGHP